MKERIGELLKKCREKAGLTQQELAEKLYVDRTTITKIETGALPQPSYMIVKEWGRVTGCTELIGMDLAGSKDGWKKLIDLEAKMKQIRELVSYMVLKR